MKKTYPIEVDCANCANLMEDAAKKTEGVADAVVNFMTQKMTVEFADGQDPKTVMKAVLKKHGMDVGSVRKPMPALIDADAAVVEESSAMIDAAIAKYC